MSKENYRKVLGERLRAFRESRGISKYGVAKKGDIVINQVTDIEEGGKNYTIDVFLGYITGCDLYMYFAEKDNKEATHDFKELIEKGIKNNPE